MSAVSKEIFLCAICNINSGTCDEDCKFCSQSVRYKADIERYKQKDMELILKEAEAAQRSGALGFCLVTAQKGLDAKSLDFVCRVADMLSKQTPKLRLIACNGTATVEQLLTLKAHGVKAYNHNLETSERFYPQICTTHSWQERYKTCQNVKEAGLMLICGGIFGLGESQEDRVLMLEAIESLKPISVPINFYHHNKALELEPNSLSVDEALELVALSRKMVPDAQRIMVAGGRELMFGERESEIFEHGANSIVIGNYLTTMGKSVTNDLEMVAKLNLKIAKSV